MPKRKAHGRTASAARFMIAMYLLWISAAVAGNPGAPQPQQVVSSARTASSGERAAAIATYARRRAAAMAQAESGEDHGAARVELAEVLSDPEFAGLKPEQQRALLSAAAWVEVMTERYADAGLLYRRAVAADPANADDWHRLSMVEDELGNYEASAIALRQVIDGWPGYIDALSGGHVMNLVTHLPKSSKSRLDLMRRLSDADWKREEGVSSELWYELALMYMDLGETGEARTVVSRIGWPSTVIKMQADRRFDGLLPRNPILATDALRELIDRLDRLSDDNPRNLYTHNELLSALLEAGETDEVLRMSERILGLLADAEQDPAPFHDGDEIVATLSRRATALRRTGQTEEALAALGRASKLPEKGHANISQKLSLGRLYNALLRPAEALNAVEDIDYMASPYDRMYRDMVQMQAYLLENQSERSREALQRMRSRQDESFHLMLMALLYLGQADEAAAHFIRQLQNPWDRGDALLMAQRTRETEPLPGEVAYRRNRDAMLARPDVRSAIAEFGRVQEYAIW